MNADNRHLVLFARRPVLGAGKRRLAHDIGEIAALRFQRFALARLTQTLGADPRWRFWLCLTPDRPGAVASGELAQGQGDLGERLTRVMKNGPPGHLVIIGGDAPQITREDIAAAFAAVGRGSAVLGPAHDGGFWLVGLDRNARRRPPFGGVRWSSPNTMADVMARMRPARVALMRELEDVDDVDSMRRVMTGLARQPPP